MSQRPSSVEFWFKDSAKVLRDIVEVVNYHKGVSPTLAGADGSGRREALNSDTVKSILEVINSASTTRRIQKAV